MELIEDIGCGQLPTSQRYFSQLEEVEFKCWFAIENLKHVALASLVLFFALIT